ncbi:MAG: transcription termination factor NusA [Endomicrobium sp.]|jgi:N utilization substance protein A|nr:transcription termination factor NusA [Endomicrobium sp.]
MTEKSEFLLTLEQIEKDKKINKKDILNVIENAVASAYRKHVGKNVIVEATVDPIKEKITANVIKTVVKKVSNPLLEINIKEAKKINKESKIGDKIKVFLNTQDFSRIAAQTAKQVIMQKIKESEKKILFDEMSKKIGQIVSGIIYRIINKSIIVDLGKTEAILPISEQNPNEKFIIGQHIRSVIIRVIKNSKGSGIILSRISTEFIKRLFELEVPEIYEKIIEIVNIVREPGTRTKIALLSHNHKVDPVGACVGIKGARIKPIIEEIRGEKIDLIPYSIDLKKYLIDSLSPSKVLSIKIISERDKKAEAIVSNNMLSLAIGKNGHNVRLAMHLTGWHINIKSEEQEKQDKYENSEILNRLNTIGKKHISTLSKAGFITKEKLFSLSVNDLISLPGIGPKTAEKILKEIKKVNYK